MRNLMDAEVLFFDPAKVGAATAELAAHGFKIKIHKHMVDPASPAVFTRITGFTELDQRSFFHWMQTIVERFGGDVSEAGHADADIDGADQVEIDEMIGNDNRRLRAV
jgi:hypothetical protein